MASSIYAIWQPQHSPYLPLSKKCLHLHRSSNYDSMCRHHHRHWMNHRSRAALLPSTICLCIVSSILTELLNNFLLSSNNLLCAIIINFVIMWNVCVTLCTFALTQWRTFCSVSCFFFSQFSPYFNFFIFLHILPFNRICPMLQITKFHVCKLVIAKHIRYQLRNMFKLNNNKNNSQKISRT